MHSKRVWWTKCCLKRLAASVLLGLSLTLPACGNDDAQTDSAPTDTEGLTGTEGTTGTDGANGTEGTTGTDSSTDTVTPLSAIVSVLLDGSYQNWPAEAAVHPATLNSPHGQVRSYYNPTLANAIAAGNTVFPQGSITVKELYSRSGTTVTGYAAMYKESTQSDEASQWYWYEIFSVPETAAEFEATTLKGSNLNLCTGCHEQAPAVDSLFTRPDS